VGSVAEVLNSCGIGREASVGPDKVGRDCDVLCRPAKRFSTIAYSAAEIQVPKSKSGILCLAAL